MSSLDNIFKAYDVRGVVPDDLDAELCRKIGWAFADFTSSGRIIVGRDCRLSGKELSAAFIDGATQRGDDVVDLGLCSTDMLYYATGRFQSPGVMFTASHNPANYNGIKFALAGAKPVGEETGLRDIRRTVERDEFTPALSCGVKTREDVLGAFVKHVLSFVDVRKMAPLKIAVDTANGMGGLVAPAVFDQLPFEITPLYFELDGTFPNHPADPIQPANIVDLRKAVVDNGCDLGLAFDGDADRVFLVDDKGIGVPGSTTTALVAKGILAKNRPAKVIYNLICSKAVPEVIVESGGEPIRSRVGHSFIKAQMAETGAIFGGEHSGHYYFRDNYRADSGLIAAVIVLEQISESGSKLSELRRPLERYADSGEINSSVADKDAKIGELAAAYADGDADHLDGLTVSYADWWFNVRPSNTEPLLRLNVEADDAAIMEQKRDELLALIRG